MTSARLGVTFLLAMAGFSLLACSSDGNDSGDGDACQQACSKLESCNPGTVCSINGPCTGQNKDIADCISKAECNQTSSCLFGGGGNPGGGGSPGSGGASGACADLAGTWSLSGTCAVSGCVISQNACSANFVCDNGAASFTGTVSTSSVHFVGATGDCDGSLAGNLLSGSCSGAAGTCQFVASKQ